MLTAFDTVLDRCRLAIRTNYRHGRHVRAEALLQAEISLIQKLGFQDVLVEIFKYCEQLRVANVGYHSIGSSGSSIVFYLLGISEVDPIEHDTHLQRLWITAADEPPIVMLVATSLEDTDFADISRPSFVSIHSMTDCEVIRTHLESKFGSVGIHKKDPNTLIALQSADTSRIFQLNSRRAKWLLTQLKPTSIEELASITALEQISCDRADVVLEYVEKHSEMRSMEHAIGRRAPVERRWSLPILFQESIMSLLRRLAKLSWADAYAFVRSAAKGHLLDQHELWKQAVSGLQERPTENPDEFIGQLADSARWAVCRAHHVANAITSYKSAYFQVHHRMDFELVSTSILKNVGMEA